MYLQTSRLQYNLQKVGVFQTAHSNKNIQAEAFKDIISYRLRLVNRILELYVLFSKNSFSLSSANHFLRLEVFTILWYNVSTSLGLNIFIGVCFLKNTKTLEIVL